MSKGFIEFGSVWSSVLERFERHAPAGVMARLALKHALPGGWVDLQPALRTVPPGDRHTMVFEAHRQPMLQRQARDYTRRRVPLKPLQNRGPNRTSRNRVLAHPLKLERQKTS
jgi:hypothetical protein